MLIFRRGFFRGILWENGVLTVPFRVLGCGI